jgi:hypothetical protein
MWTEPNAGAGSNASDVYRLQLSETNYTYDAYATIAAPAQWRIDQSVWDHITASNLGATDPLNVTLSRWDSATNKSYVSATMAWTIAPASLRGAIYYWTASKPATGPDVGHITRLYPGTGAVAEPLNQGKCMGCHAVSADGTTLVAAVDDPSAPADPPYVLSWQQPPTRAWASFDVSQSSAPMIYQSTQYGADIALTPDGTYSVWGAPTNVVGSKVLSLSNTKTGALVTASGLDNVTGLASGDNLSMPAFSPDGTSLAVVRGPAADNVLPTSKAIDYLAYDQMAHTFNPALIQLVTASDPAFTTTGSGLGYPSFTPDSKSIAFHSGTYSTGCQGTCDDTSSDDGDLFFASVTTPGSPIRLANVDDPPNAADHDSSIEPTFNPNARGGYSWFVFTSMRDYGNALTGAKINGKRRLWVAAIDQTTGATDPSHPGFYLDGQEDSPNMRGFWALAACTQTGGASSGSDAGAPTSDAGSANGTCVSGFECCSGFCNQGVCVDVQTLACVATGGACSGASDCCNGGTGVVCNSGTCAVQEVK